MWRLSRGGKRGRSGLVRRSLGGSRLGGFDRCTAGYVSLVVVSHQLALLFVFEKRKLRIGELTNSSIQAPEEPLDTFMSYDYTYAVEDTTILFCSFESCFRL